MNRNIQVLNNDLPIISVENLNFKKIEKQYFKVIKIKYLIFIIFIYIALIIANLFIEKITIPYISYFIPIIIIGIFFYISYKSFPKRKYALREKDISYQSGWLNFSLTTVPFNRIQHIEIENGFIEHKFHLATLIVYTAGDDSSDLTIKGLTSSNALKIKEYITSKINDE